MTAEQFGGVVRAVVAAVGGYFVGKGLIDASMLTSLAGAAASVAAAIWSVWIKKA